MSEPIRLFVGCSVGEDTESQAVLEYTVRKLASRDVQIVWMQQARKGFWAGWNTDRWGTPFSGFRFGIPAFCNYEGRAIYVDSDFWMQADLAELFDQDMHGSALMVRKPGQKFKTCCILFDCAASRKFLPDIDRVKAMFDQNGKLHRQFGAVEGAAGAFQGDWNCIDGGGYQDLNDPRIKAIHYSKMPCQPHLKYAIPRLKEEGRTHWYDGKLNPHWRPDLVDRFDTLYAEAIDAGYTPDKYWVEPFGKYVKKSWSKYVLPKSKGGV